MYGFDDNLPAVRIDDPHAPAPWINYLSNGSLHAFVSQAGGGMCWWKSPLSFRLSRYRFYNLPLDSPGFYIYLRESDGTVWSPTWRPVETPLDSWQCLHQPGQTRFLARRGGLEAQLNLFITPDVDAMVWQLELRHTDPTPREIDVFAYVELSLLGWKEEVDWGQYVKHNLKTWFDETIDAQLYLYTHHYHRRTDDIPLVWFASDRPTRSHAGDRDAFVGPYRTERNPVAVERGDCGNSSMICGEPCAALQVAMPLESGRASTTRFFLGVTPRALKHFDEAMHATRATLAQLRDASFVASQRSQLENWWRQHLGKFTCQLPDDQADAQRMINTWNPVQCVHTARYSRSISSSAPGIRGVGFRDTCQDLLAIVPRDADWARRGLLDLLAQQYADGHVVHSAFPEDRLPPATSVHSDDHLWLPLLAHTLIAETGDLSLLHQEVSYLLTANATLSGEPRTGTVWQHLLRAIDFTESHLGAHGLPLILRSDWNDIIGRFNRAGRGESVFAAQQYVHAMKLLIELADAIGDDASRRILRDRIARQSSSILEHGWDGGWWRRCFDDSGLPIGTRDCTFGRIWLNSQTWAVIAGVGSPHQHRGAMDAVAEHLDTGMGLAKLWPSFKTWPEVSDPFSGYSPGCGENGAIFCHANTWAIIAEALLGNVDRAWKYYRQLIPHVACQKAGAARYQAEPYAYVSNIVGPENPKFGWANVTQVTGAAAWMEVAATQYLLGVRAELRGLRIDPRIPRDWRKFSVSRLYRGCRLSIDVHNPNGVGADVHKMTIDGREIDLSRGSYVPSDSLAGKETATVRVELR